MADEEKLISQRLLISDLHVTHKSSNDIDYAFEEQRVKSFSSWQVQYPVDPARLAKAGFYYTGKEDEVVCFSCQGHIKNWSYGDVVLTKHSEFFPNCDFVNNRSKNIPINKKMNTAGTKIGNNPFARSLIDFDKMKFMEERLKTFDNWWPVSFLSAKKMAEAGFFYLGFNDKVQCAFCKGIVKDWEASDDPIKEHIKHFPWCGFLCHLANNSNSKFLWFQCNGEDLCGNMKRPEHNSKLIQQSKEQVQLINLGVQIHTGSVHPTYSSLDSRLNSFARWPLTSPVSKTELANAGFFYTGISDHTKCFHCNGGLCQWENGDDPWFEHARWFQNCDFIRMTKGQAFIDTCLKQYHLHVAPEHDPEQWSSLSEFLIIKVDEAMKSSLVVKFLESGIFPSCLVRAAILQQLKETGCNFNSIENLCLAVTCLKDKMEEKPLKVNSIKASDLNIHDIDIRKCSTNPDIVEQTLESEFVKTSVVSQKLDVPILHSKADGENHHKDQCLCKICMDKEVGVVFLPCGHLLACVDCSPALKLCPMCRQTIQATVRAYLP